MRQYDPTRELLKGKSGCILINNGKNNDNIIERAQKDARPIFNCDLLDMWYLILIVIVVITRRWMGHLANRCRVGGVVVDNRAVIVC